MTTSIYELQPVLGDPRYSGFGIFDSEYSEMFDYRNMCRIESRTGYNTRYKPIKHQWKDFKAEGKVTAFNDYPCVGLVNPCFSMKAKLELEDLLENCGDFIEMKTEFGLYYIFHIRISVNIINIDKSELKLLHLSNGESRISYEKYVHIDLPNDFNYHFFMIDSFSGNFVSNEFAQRVKDCHLNGFNFIKLWPLPPNSNWKHYWEPENQDDLTRQRDPVMPGTKAYSAILDLDSAAENKHLINIILEAIEIQFPIPRRISKKNYFGCMEHHEIVNNTLKCYFSCPNLNVVEAKIKSIITSLNWLGNKQLLCKFAELNSDLGVSYSVDLE